MHCHLYDVDLIVDAHDTHKQTHTPIHTHTHIRTHTYAHTHHLYQVIICNAIHNKPTINRIINCKLIGQLILQLFIDLEPLVTRLEGVQFTGACPRQAREVGSVMKDRILVVTSFEEDEKDEEEKDEEEEEGEDDEGKEDEEEGEGGKGERVIDYGVPISSNNSESESESAYGDNNSNSNNDDNNDDDRLLRDLPAPSFSSSSSSYLDFRALFATTSTSTSPNPSSTTSFVPIESKDILENEADQLIVEVDSNNGRSSSPPATDEDEDENEHVSSMGSLFNYYLSALLCHVQPSVLPVCHTL